MRNPLVERGAIRLLRSGLIHWPRHGTFFGEAFHFHLALPHPLVERSHEAEFVGDTSFGISAGSESLGPSGI
jgi:hypothetical protein